MANKRKRLSSAEWRVMTALWKAGRGATVQAVREKLPDNPRRDYRTIQTLLHRMAEKGWVRCVRRDGRVYYSARVGLPVGVRERTRELLAEIRAGGEEAVKVARVELERRWGS